MGYAYNPQGSWTARHQMSVNGKFDGITREDLLAFASANGVKDGAELIGQVCDAAARWPEMAREVGVPDAMIKGIVHNMQLSI
jgi:serine/threonine-protein kinase HipA